MPVDDCSHNTWLSKHQDCGILGKEDLCKMVGGFLEFNTTGWGSKFVKRFQQKLPLYPLISNLQAPSLDFMSLYFVVGL